MCARLILEAVLYGDIATHGPDDKYLQLKVVFVLTADDDDEVFKSVEDQIIMSGTIELNLETRTLELSAKKYVVDEAGGRRKQPREAVKMKMFYD